MADRPLFIRLSMPSGLEDALEGLAREILRCQPKDMYEFAAQYFEGLLRARNKEMGIQEDDPYGLNFTQEQQDQALTFQDIGKTEDEEIDIDLDDPEVAAAATKIQAGFRGSQVRKEVTAKRQEHVDIDDEIIHEDKNSYTAIQVQMPAQDEEESQSPQVEEEIDIDLEDPEVAAAATKIQAGFKGKKARDEVKKMKEDKDVDFTTESVPNIEVVSETPVSETPEPDNSHDQKSAVSEIDASATVIQEGYYKVKETFDETTIENEEEIIDIDLEDPEVNAAATKIQAGFKGKKARDEVKQMKEQQLETNTSTEAEKKADNEEEIDIDLDDPEVNEAATKIQASFKGKKARDEVKKMKENIELEIDAEKKEQVEVDAATVEEEIDIDLDDPEVNEAATKIQASFKGKKARDEVKKMKEEKEVDESAKIDEPKKEEDTVKEKEEEEIDIDLDDPEVNEAATKIQASFKGKKARDEVKKMKEEKEADESTKIDEPEKVEDAAKEKEEEEIDIDLDDPEVNEAATKIQASFKGKKARDEVKKMKEEKEVEESTNKEEDEKIEERNDEEIDIDLDDPEVNEAATKIQASFKGKKARDEVKKMKEEKDTLVSENKTDDTEAATTMEEEIDIDLDDPEVNEAATKIQASFKGKKARDEVKKMKEEKEVDDAINKEEHEKVEEAAKENEEEEIDIDLDDPEVNEAATKIQASFKGKKARDEVKKMKEEKEVDESAKIDEPEKEEDTVKVKEEEEIDIDLDDPEVNEAATKIQASFKGKKARDEVKKMKEVKEVDESTNVDEPEKVEDTAMEKDEEEIDIDLDDPEVNEAATKIQASFKGKKARDEVKKMKEEKEVDYATNIGEPEEVDEIAKENEEEEIDIDLDDPEVNEAATKIQASFKGKKARDEVKKMKEERDIVEPEKDNDTEIVEAVDLADVTEDEIDIDLDDPEVNEAATKIQASFKGKKARDEVKKMKEEKETVASEIEEEAQDVKVEEVAAATEEEIDIDLDDPEVNEAATKIQASFKGKKARDEVKKIKEDQIMKETQKNEAAAKIQAGFKGKRARDEVREMKKVKEKYVSERAVFLNYPASAKQQKAAAKIQAGFKGMKTRKKMKQRKLIEVVEEDEELEEEEIRETVQVVENTNTEEDGSEKNAKDLIQEESNENKDVKEEKEVDESLNIDDPEKLEDAAKEKEGEEIDIDLDDPEVNEAATKIQASFKGKKARDEVKKMKEEKEVEESTNKVELEEVEEIAKENEEEEIDIDLDDPEVNEAATKIQASFKGKKARDEVKKMKEEKGVDKSTIIEESEKEEVAAKEKEEEEIDIDLDDPEVNEAATKIQASFKGKKARDEVKKMKEDKESENVDRPEIQLKEVSAAEEEEIDIDLDDPEVNEAATKIQASFKGKKARDEVKKMKEDAAAEDSEMKAEEKGQSESELEVADSIVESEPPTVDDTAPEEQKVVVEIEASETTNSDELKETTEDSGRRDSIIAQIGVHDEGADSEEKVEAANDETPEDSEKRNVEEAVPQPDEHEPQCTEEEPNKDEVDEGSEIRPEIVEEVEVTTKKESDIDETTIGQSETENQTKTSSSPPPIDQEQRLEEKVDDKTELKLDDSESPESTEEQAHAGEEAPGKEEPSSTADELPGPEETSTEMLIQEAAEVQDQELRPLSHTEDDGYISPEFTGTTSFSSMQSSPVKSAKLELTGKAAHLHEPHHEDNVLTMVSQESVTDSDMIMDETSSEITQSADEINFALGLQDPYNTVLDEINEEAGSSKLSSLVTVANAEDLDGGSSKLEVDEDDEKLSSLVTIANADDLETNILDSKQEVDLSATAVPLVQDEQLSNNEIELDEKKEVPKETITLYHSKGSYNSEKVLIYLYERSIPFVSFIVDLSKGEQFSKWFLKINPKGEVPVLTIKDPSRHASDPRSFRVITESSRIIHSLESKYEDDLPSPRLVPLSEKVEAYQFHVYFTAMFEQLPLNVVSHGLAFHDHLAIEPESPYILDNYEVIKDMVLNREAVLNEAANDQASSSRTETEPSVIELRRKAMSHKTNLSQYTNFDDFKKLLKQTAGILEKAEIQLKKNMNGDAEDDCEGWILNTGFSVVDIVLGVVLQRLAKLGLRHYFWSHGKRPFVHKFFRQIVQRHSFVKAIPRLAVSEIGGPKPKLQKFDSSLESKYSLDEMDMYVQIDEKSSYLFGDKKPPPLKVAAQSKESMEVFHILHEGKIKDEKEDSEVYRELKLNYDTDEGLQRRTKWKQLWISDDEEDNNTTEKNVTNTTEETTVQEGDLTNAVKGAD